MRKRICIALVLLSFLIAGLVVGCGTNNAPSGSTSVTPSAPADITPPAPTHVGNYLGVLVKKVDSMPKIDGNPDDLEWKNALGVAGDNCTLKAIYTDDEIAFLYTINAPKMSIVTPDSWYYDGDEFIQWRENVKEMGEKPKREFTLLNMAWEKSEFGLEGGCNYMCHSDDDYDDGIKHHVVPSGAGADLWNMLCKHGYGDPERIYDTGFPLGYLGAYQEGIISFDASSKNDPFKVTSGTFNFIGWADERIQTSRDNPDYVGKAKDTETGRYCTQCHSTSWMEAHPLQGKQGKMPYRRNAVGFDGMYATAPEYIKLNPKDFADAMIITDKDIEEGRAAKISSLSKDEIKKAWARYKEVNCLIPGFILQEPTENMAQVLQGAQWSDGIWTIELKRNRVTDYPLDIQFDDINRGYVMSSAVPGGGFGQNVGIKFVLENPDL